jgi:hypothetical protein
MVRCKRSLTAFVIAMLFGMSVVGHGFAATSMSMSMAGAMPADMSADNSMDCDGKDIRKPDCFALCAIAILPDSARLPIAAIVQAVADAPARSLPSQDRSPDPYPPKPLTVT